MAEKDMNKTLGLEARFDCELISTGGGSTRHLLIDVEARAEKDHRTQRRPLNLALVIDVSTSMRGSRLANAKKAAVQLIESLSDRDFLSVVSFGRDVQVHFSGLEMNRSNRELAARIVSGLEHRMFTNLSTGWLEGAACVAATMDSVKDLHSHVILLSDGYANVGILDSEELTEHARQLRLREVYTSTVGIGNDYCSTLLRQLADHGGGRLHDAEHPEEIVSVLKGELEELRSSLVNDLVLKVTLPRGCRVESLSGYPKSLVGKELTLNLGSITDGACKRAVVRIFAPQGEDGEWLTFKCSVDGKLNADKRVQAADDAGLGFADGRRYKTKKLDPKVALTVAQIWHAQVVGKAAEINRNGNVGMLHMFIQREMAHFVVYTKKLPEADYLVQEFSLMLENHEKAWSERLRKEMELSSYRTLTTSVDYRDKDRDPWTTTMGGF